MSTPQWGPWYGFNFDRPWPESVVPGSTVCQVLKSNDKDNTVDPAERPTTYTVAKSSRLTKRVRFAEGSPIPEKIGAWERAQPRK